MRAVAHPLRQRDRIAGELATARIETLRYENVAPHPHQPARRQIFTSRFGPRCNRANAARLTGIQRSQPKGRVRAGGCEQKLLAAGKEAWHPVAGLSFAQLYYRRSEEHTSE